MGKGCSVSHAKYQTRKTTIPNTEKRVENMTRSGIFLTKFEVLGNRSSNAVLSVSYILSIETQIKEKMEK